MSAAISVRKRHDTDMTSGGILKHLILFSLPLLAGNLFQQLYNMVDSWVVGNFVSDSAFAAVGTVGSYVNVLIGFFMGFSGGAGVVISQYYGAKQYKKVHDTVHTSILMSLIMGAVFTVAGIVTIPFVLKNIMKFPADVYPEAKTYLTIYFAGIIGLLIYNIGSGILRAVGDSTRPFYFLVVSAVLNTVLDLVFVLVFDMGVAGVAYATIIAQFVSAILVLLSLTKSDNCIMLRFSELRINTEMLKKIIVIGFPSAIQIAITSFSNMFVYSYINFFGKDMMGGWTAFSRVDQFVLLPLNSLSIAISTFVGQNVGKGDIKRANNGVMKCFVLGLVTSVILIIPVTIFAPQLTAFFNNSEGVIRYGTLVIRTLMPFYLLCCISLVFSGALRGSGNTKTPMIIMLSCYVVFRQCYLYVVANFLGNTEGLIIFSFPAGWILCSAITLIYYFAKGLKTGNIVDNTEKPQQSVKA